MRRWIVTLVLLAGCGSGAAPHAAAPPARCVASAPGRYEVHRARERLAPPGVPLVVFSHGH